MAGDVITSRVYRMYSRMHRPLRHMADGAPSGGSHGGMIGPGQFAASKRSQLFWSIVSIAASSAGTAELATAEGYPQSAKQR